MSVCSCSNTNSNNNSNNTSSTNSISSKKEEGYYTVKFDLNYDVVDDTYKNVVIFSGQSLKEPEEPNRRDYVFNGWYLEEECQNKFDKFGQEINDNITLYASWFEYSELKDYEKIDKFVDKLGNYIGKVSKTKIEEEGIERYYSPVDQAFGFYQNVEYNRYKDITTADYYDENGNKYASQQYFYDDVSFYNIYNDIEGEGKDNEKKVAPFSLLNVDSFLSIDFITLFCDLLDVISTQIKNGHSYDEMDYGFDFNYTYLNQYEVNYSFSIDYYTYLETEDLGAVEEVYMMEYGLTFINGMLNKSIVTQQFMMGIQGEVQFAIEDTIRAEYEITDEYSKFTGDKFDPSDFN